MPKPFSTTKSPSTCYTPTPLARQQSFDMVDINKAAIFAFQFQGRVPPIDRFSNRDHKRCLLR